MSLQELVKGILALSAEQINQQSIRVEFDEETNIPDIKADSEWLRSCFSNLLLNAQQAMPAGGTLSISFRSFVDGIETIITDTGGGIVQSDIDKIFEPYFSTKETGTGIGLALVKKIVEDHKGSIKVESQLNQGTTMCVWLPCDTSKSLEQVVYDRNLYRSEEAVYL